MRTTKRSVLGCALVVAVLALSFPRGGDAATFLVDSVLDLADAAPGDGTCATVSAVCTLRAAVQEANALPGDHTVSLPAGTYVLTLPESDGESSTGALVLTGHVTINGAGQDDTILEGGGNDRVILVTGTAIATIADLTVRNGRADSGAGIRNDATLGLARCTVSGNSAGYEGGGIENWGALSVGDSTVRDNVSGYQGGGIDNNLVWSDQVGTIVTGSRVTGNSAGYEGGGLNNYGRLAIADSVIDSNSAGYGGGGVNIGKGLVTIEGSTIGHNTARYEGGGIDTSSSWLGQPTVIVDTSTISANSSEWGGGGINNTGGLELRRSTVSGNQAGADGGGIDNESTFYGPATAIITNSTISENSAGGAGGGLANNDEPKRVTLNNVTIAANSADGDVPGGGIGGGARLANSIVAGNLHAGVADECAGLLESEGHNLIQTMSCEITGDVGVLVGLDPLLGPLADHGGPTLTHALLAGSPAMDSGSPLASCSGFGACESLDQTGAARPQGGACDMGALEVQTDSPPLPEPCAAGASIGRARLVLRNLGGPAGSVRTALRGLLTPPPSGKPGRPMRVLLEDLGDSSTPLDLTAFPATKVRTYRSRDGRLGVVLHTRHATIDRPVGPLRATVIFGDEGFAGATCGTYTFWSRQCRPNRTASRLTCEAGGRGDAAARPRSAADTLPDLSGSWMLAGTGTGEACLEGLLVPAFVSSLAIRQCGPRLTAVGNDRWFTGTVSAGGVELEAGSAGSVFCETGDVAALPRLGGTLPLAGGEISLTQGFDLLPIFGSCSCSTVWSGTMSRSGERAHQGDR